MNQKRLLMIDKLIIFNNDNNNNPDHQNIKDQSSNTNGRYYKRYLEAYHYQSLKTFTSKSTSKLWPNDHRWSSLTMNGDDVSEEGSTTVTLKYPSTNDFLWCSSSMWLLAIIIVIYLTIFDCLIIHTRVMASNPYVSGIKLPGNQIEDQTFYGEIKSLIGGRAELPCNLTLPSPDDAIQLIFWHRGNNTRVPIYTVDGRASQTLSNATHFLSDIFAPNRAIYDLTTKPSVLRIDPVLETDHSDYRCRVDFRWGRTINSFVSLHVIVPPKKITIRDQHGNYVHNSTIGPYDQNTDVILTCESNGGVPPPTLQWYKNGVMMDGSYVVGNDGLVSNELTVYKLSSNDLYDKYVCQAGNYNSSNSNPIEAFVVLDINLLPIDVRIVTNRSRLISGRKIEIKCETYGSKPAAIIKWFLNDKLLSHSTENYESNRTTSSITLIPSMMDNQALLKCRAYNPRMLPKGYFSSTSTTTTNKIELSPDKYLESVWKLEILYSPLVQLKIREVTTGGNTLNENGQSKETIPTSKTTGMTMMMMTKPIMVINAKTSIIVECFVQANPSLVDLQIFHNSTIIQMHKQLDVQYQNVTKFLIDSVDPSHGGRYQCVASNQQGITRSNIIQLDVLYAPFCKDYGQIKSLPHSELSKMEKLDSGTSDATKFPSNKYIQYALALNESVKLKCDVESNPKATRFYWTLNSDWLDENRIIAQSDHDNELIYTARSSDSYGTISCWASNNIGVQQEPCGFLIQKAGPPSPLHGCSVTNKTTTSLTVECFPGDNGGSKQMFHAHIFESTNSDDEDNDSLENAEHDEHHDLSQSILSNNKPKMHSKNDKKEKQNNHQNQHQQLESSLKSEINLTSATSPIFYLNNLTPGTSYKIELYAKNDRGNSDVVRLSVTTLFTKNTKLISSSLQEYEYDSWFSVLIGFLLTILLAVVAIYIVCRVRQRQISLKNRRKEEQIKQNFAFRPPNTNQSYLNVSDVDTDLIATAAASGAISSSSSATSTAVPVNNDNEDKVIADDDAVMVGGRDFLQASPMVDLKTVSKTTNSKNNSLKTPKTTMTTSNMNFGTKKSQQQQQIHHQTPDIISFDSSTMDTTTNSNKLSLYVINEEDPSSSISLSNLLNKNNIHHHRQQLHHGSAYSNHNLDPNPELQPIQLTTGSLLIGATAANVCDINVSNHHHVPTIFGSPFLATTNPNPLNNSTTGVTILTSNPHHHPHCLISSTSTPSGSSMTDTPPPSSSTQSLPPTQAVAPPASSLSQQQHHYFINASNPHETATAILYTSTIQPQTILSLNDKIDGIVLSTDHNDYYSQHDGQSMATSSSATPEATAILLHHPGHQQQQQQRFHQEISTTDEEICDFNLQQTAV